jgi:NAD-dependent SIR2 family protein deacetylase
MLEIRCFLEHPEASWPVLKEVFYDHFGEAKPNRAHEVLAAWEARGLLKTLITQNIDDLHDMRVAGMELKATLTDSSKTTEDRTESILDFVFS